MESIGARLKKVRLAKGLTLEDARKETHTHISILKAIEEDSLINISPIYIRSFLKNYCKFLGEDPAQYITDYRESQTPQVANPRHEGKTLSLLKDASVNMALKLKPRLKIKVFGGILVGIAAAIILFTLIKTAVVRVSIFFHRIRPAATITGKPDRKELSQATTGNKPALASTISAKERQIPLAVTATSGVKLTIYARDNCLVEVKSDGKMMFRGKLKKGRSESWPAKEKIELSLSNAGAVDLQINSKHINRLGTKGQSLKNIIITKDSLIVPR